MSESSDEAVMAGRSGAFPTTHWTEIFDARSDDEPRRWEALEDLLSKYWKPVCCFLRCRGYDPEAAKDLTQGFFHEIVLGRGLIRQAERTRGRFRTFLLNALERYATSVHRAQRAKQRFPEGGLVPFETTDWLKALEPVKYATPIEAFDYAWASALLDEVIAEVAAECREASQETHWAVFRARVLQPMMDGSEPPSLRGLCEKYDVPTRKKASNMVITVKRRFQLVLRRCVRQLVGSDTEVDDEIRNLIEIFRRSRAAS